MNRAAVIMAGGSGTRLWPLSRRSRPKQLLRIFNGTSLLRQSFERLRALLPAESIHIISLAEHLPAIADELPELPRMNLIGEPMGRDTANAIALAAAVLHERNPDTTMGVFTADHIIRPIERFAEIVSTGYEAAENHADALVTFGIRPMTPQTGLGYVQRGEPAGVIRARPLWKVKEFKEKPDRPTAERYLTSGDFYWNSGMFVWRTQSILDRLAQFLPQTHAAVRSLAAAWDSAQIESLLREAYPQLAKISIDYAVMEKSPNVLLVEMDLDWIDVGSWTALPAVLGIDKSGNTHAATNSAILSSANNIFVTEDDHLIATVGLEDLIVVHSPDATLICRREDAQRIKELLDQVVREHGDRYS